LKVGKRWPSAVISGVPAALGTIIAASPDARAFPDGAPWETADDPEGCRSCHFDSPDAADSQALGLDGLPERIVAGRSYALMLVLNDESLELAGFLLSVSAAGEPAGRLDAPDGTIETAGAQARSTRDGAEPKSSGLAVWQLHWTAPDELEQPVRFDVWANAGNDDESPFGDRTYHRIWTAPVDASTRARPAPP
jgi:hypothetical protein